MTVTKQSVDSLFTKSGMEQIMVKFMDLTGATPSERTLRYMWERAATQVAHRDFGLVGVGLGCSETKSGSAQWVEFPREFFIL